MDCLIILHISFFNLMLLTFLNKILFDFHTFVEMGSHIKNIFSPSVQKMSTQALQGRPSSLLLAPRFSLKPNSSRFVLCHGLCPMPIRVKILTTKNPLFPIRWPTLTPRLKPSQSKWSTMTPGIKLHRLKVLSVYPGLVAKLGTCFLTNPSFVAKLEQTYKKNTLALTKANSIIGCNS